MSFLPLTWGNRTLNQLGLIHRGHARRVSHPDITGTDRIVAPSAVAIEGDVYMPTGKAPYPVPHALTTAELSIVRQEFVDAARRAVDAGMDGVEVHSANGYLLHGFLSSASNQRTDGYGGGPAERARFVVEVTAAVAAEVGAGRVGIRISPAHNIQDVAETDEADVAATYRALVEGLAPLGLAYLSVLHREPDSELVRDLAARFNGPIMLNTGFGAMTTRQEAQQLVDQGLADVVAVGRAAIANPDLVERWAGDHPENEPDVTTFYAGGADGYTDYPRLTA
ncbi:oxidoreductase [Nakamurella panacisegetis]|uniref:oxidoreductase n=1 Tax=Nakamurella panacisegetis TaxID=1090615 RepID=UPI000AA06AAA|nr:alkene reductase [Nakamurella panacisegetis]